MATSNGKTKAAAQATTPRGAVIHKLSRHTVSEGFVRSLSDDGVSPKTIKSIERENARRAENGAVQETDHARAD
jgi:hypothetical protein